MKVCQYLHANQFELRGEGKLCLQSYDSLVVEIDTTTYPHKITLGRDWDYSTTTSKHVYMFLEDYTDINFYGVSNKRAYVNKLIKECKIESNEEMF